MKNARKFVFRISVVLILLIGVIGCDGCKNGTDPITGDQEVKKKEVEDIIISEDQAKIRFENYGEHRAKIIKAYENNGRRLCDPIPQKPKNPKSKMQEQKKTANQKENKEFVPVEYTYYDFEQFKKYIKFIEQETKKGGAKITNLRVYFANYPEDEGGDDKRKRNTVMFVPTIKVGDKEFTYYLSDEGNEGKIRPILLNDSFAIAKNQGSVGSLEISKEGNKASILPNISGLLTSASPLPPYYQSVIGNEGNRNP